MKRLDFNVGQRFRYHGETFTVTKKSGYPVAPRVRIRYVQHINAAGGAYTGYFFLDELREWARAGLVEFVK